MREETVAEYIERRRASLVGALFLYCGDRDAAEELAQESFVRLWQRWGAVDDPDRWVHRVAFNLARSRWRRRQAERRALERVHARPVEPALGPEHAAVVTTVLAALTELTPRQREAVVRRYFMDEPVAEIAEAMRCATGTVKATLHQAVGRLRSLDVDVAEEFG